MAERLRDPAQSIACKHLPIPPPLPPFALLRFARRAAVPEIQSVEEIENVPPGGQNRLHFETANTLFFVLRTDDCGADLVAEREAALPPGPLPPRYPAAGGEGGPPPRNPPPRPDPPSPPPGGRRGGGPSLRTPSRHHRAALPPGGPPPRTPPTPPPGGLPSHHQAAGGKARSRCAARGCAGVRTDALELRCSPSGNRSGRWIPVLSMLSSAMPSKPGPPREYSSEAARGVAIGWFRNANNRDMWPTGGCI